MLFLGNLLHIATHQLGGTIIMALHVYQCQLRQRKSVTQCPADELRHHKEQIGPCKQVVLNASCFCQCLMLGKHEHMTAPDRTPGRPVDLHLQV
jgi:hypothetical protein